MRLIIISGRSGSGKSTALHVLEDIGFTCIDNLPVSLLPTLIEKLPPSDNRQYAVSIDARNTESEIQSLPYLVELPLIATLHYQIFFFDAADDILLKRFSETRRKHPLSNDKIDLQDALVKEKQLLKPIIDLADVTIDTSDMGFHDLRDFIKQRGLSLEAPTMAIQFQAFGFKYGLPRDLDLVFDVRCLPNPHWKAELRVQTGNDQGVVDFLAQQTPVINMYNDIRDFLTRWLPHYKANNRSYITVGIGCTGGRHRSVYLCNQLAMHFKQVYSNVQSRHRELS